jgi:hypothetical protein
MANYFDVLDDSDDEIKVQKAAAPAPAAAAVSKKAPVGAAARRAPGGKFLQYVAPNCKWAYSKSSCTGSACFFNHFAREIPMSHAALTAAKSRTSGFTKTQNEGAVAGPRRTERRYVGLLINLFF